MTPPAVERPLSDLVRRLREVQVAEGFDDLTSEEADERTIAEAANAIEALEKENAALKAEIQQAKQAAIEEFCAPDMCWAKGMDEVAREHIAVVEARATAAEHKAEAAQGVIEALQACVKAWEPLMPAEIESLLTAYQDTADGGS